MKQFKGTPPPWFYSGKHDESDVRYVRNSNTYTGCNDVCTLYMGSASEQEANAKLIAAAPDLLEALQDAEKALFPALDNAFGEKVANENRELMQVRAAINKALGE